MPIIPLSDTTHVVVMAAEAGENHCPAPIQEFAVMRTLLLPLLFVAAFAVDADAARVARQHAPKVVPKIGITSGDPRRRSHSRSSAPA